jgi:hypothetical protein
VLVSNFGFRASNLGFRHPFRIDVRDKFLISLKSPQRTGGQSFMLLFLEIDLEWKPFVPGGEIVRFLGRKNTLLGFL